MKIQIHSWITISIFETFNVCIYWPSQCAYFGSISIEAPQGSYFPMSWTIPVTRIPSISLVIDFWFFDSAFSRFWFFLFWTFRFWRFFGWRFFRGRMWSWPRAWSWSWFLRGRVGCGRYHTLIGQSFWISLWSFVILNDFLWHGLKK